MRAIQRVLLCNLQLESYEGLRLCKGWPLHIQRTIRIQDFVLCSNAAGPRAIGGDGL